MTEEIVEYSSSAGRGSGAMVQTDLASAAGVYALAAMDEQEFNARLAALKTAQRRAATIQRELMTKDVDYGLIPGTGQKPTLFKPGAEKMATMFGLRADDITTDIVYGDGVTAPHISVTARCPLKNPQGVVVAMGAGNCNSWESRYRWRTAQRACPKCGNVGTILRSKQDGGWFCWAKKGGCGATFRAGDRGIEGQMLGKVENTEPFDLLNTILKMSIKRAFVDATLRATATSGLFTQDVEDMPAEAFGAVSEAPVVTAEAPIEGEVIQGDVPPQVKMRDEILAMAKRLNHNEAWLDAIVGAQPPKGYGKVFAALDERELQDFAVRMRKFQEKKEA